MKSTRRVNGLLPRLESAAKAALVSMNIRNSDVLIFLLSDREMRRLERTYLKKDKKIVDVLSFSEPNAFPHPESGRKFLGEIYLNKELEDGTTDRFLFLMIHGFLHLLGFSHDKKGDTIEMENKEKKLLREFASKSGLHKPAHGKSHDNRR